MERERKRSFGRRGFVSLLAVILASLFPLSLLYEALDWFRFLQSYPVHEINGYPLHVYVKYSSSNIDLNEKEEKEKEECPFNIEAENDDGDDALVQSIRDEMFTRTSTKNLCSSGSNSSRLFPLDSFSGNSDLEPMKLAFQNLNMSIDIDRDMNFRRR